MPHKDPARKRECDRLYRERNREKIKANKRRWQIDNRERITALEMARYHADPEPFHARRRAYESRFIEKNGERPSARRARLAFEADPEGERRKRADKARKSYHADPLVAARRRARTTLAATLGVPSRLLPKELIEAKAWQLLAWKAGKETRG